MALIDCRDCRRKVSKHAEACPACGYPVRRKLKQARRRRLRAAAVLALLTAAAFGAAWLSWRRAFRPAASAEAAARF